MRPLICPQCGGQITQYAAGATFTTCAYCSTRFVIEENKAPRAQVVSTPVEPPELNVDPTSQFVKVLGGVIAAIAIFGFVALVSVKTKKAPGTATLPYLYRTPSPAPAVTPTPDLAILRFAAQEDANTIAVDGKGGIYVGDNKLRVQEFDAAGQFVRRLEVPANTRYYDRAHTIDKIAVDAGGRLYVAVGGVILVYGPEWKGIQRTVQVAPDYIQDFALKADGSMLAVSDNDRVETLLFVSKGGGITRRVEGFHTDALNAAVSPLETAAELVRVAVDRQGDIFSAYAVGVNASFTLSYDDDDLRIAKFTPNGKFVKAFAPPGKIAALAFDANDRLLISTGDIIIVYDLDGNNLASRTFGFMDSFAVDKDGYIYTIKDSAVAKFGPME